MIAPPPVAAMRVAATAVRRVGPFRLMSMILSNSASLVA